MDIAIVFEWFAQESAFAAGLTRAAEREIWTRLALLWALAAAQCPNEAGALGENAAVYLSSDRHPEKSRCGGVQEKAPPKRG